jgi:hypothetical protein
MSPYKIPLPIEHGFRSPFAEGERAFRVEAVNATVDALAGTRSLTLEISHPGLIWTGKSLRLSFIPLYNPRSTSGCL